MAKDASPKPEWYADGLRFECTQCGNCCTGPPGAVWFSAQEAASIAAHLGMREAAFRRRYAHRINGRWSLRETEAVDGYDCVFLDRTSAPGKALCSIYPVRPAQCRTWPFWPENLATPRSWATVKHCTPCPGMNSGELIPIERIRILRDETSS